MQILHYENGQKYEPHFDYFHDEVNLQLGGHRIATVLMYLSNVKKGGETVFPMWEVRTHLIFHFLSWLLITKRSSKGSNKSTKR